MQKIKRRAENSVNDLVDRARSVQSAGGENKQAIYADPAKIRRSAIPARQAVENLGRAAVADQQQPVFEQIVRLSAGGTGDALFDTHLAENITRPFDANSVHIIELIKSE